MSFSKLTAAESERLILLIEECGEVIQAATKALRHGFETTHPDFDDLTNRGQLAEEIGQVLASIALLCDAKDVAAPEIERAKEMKLARVGEYLHSAENVRRADRLAASERAENVRLAASERVR